MQRKGVSAMMTVVDPRTGLLANLDAIRPGTTSVPAASSADSPRVRVVWCSAVSERGACPGAP